MAKNRVRLKIKAYQQLVEGWNYQGGYDYYIVAMGIPMQEKIYYEIEVINIQKAHPILSGMNRKDAVDKGMRVNDELWKGLSG